MAFKKTTQRGASISPTGMPDLSGFRQSANAFDQLSQLAYGIGTQERQREYNSAIRQAEIDGQTAGVTYDEKGNLVPLTNLDYGKAAALHSPEDQDKVLQQYRKAAINTYVSAAINDIDDAATQALIANPNDPDGIRGAYEGHFNELRDTLDPEIFAKLAPRAEAAFMKAENRALAAQQEQAEKDAIAILTKEYSNNMVELANVSAKGAGSGGDNQNAHMRRLSEIQERQEELLESLSTKGVGKSQIDALRKTQETSVAIRSAQAHVKRAFAVNSYSGALEAVQQIVDESYNNPEIDSDKLAQVLYSTAQKEELLRKTLAAEDSRARDFVYNNIARQIYVEDADVTDMLADPFNPIHTLQGNQIGSLQAVSTAQIQADNNAAYADSFSVLDNPEIFNHEAQIDAMAEIDRQYIKGDISAKQKNDARAKHAKNTTDSWEKATAGNRFKASGILRMELGRTSSYTISPAYYEKEETISKLEKDGIIGGLDGAAYKDRLAYLNDVESYAVNYDKHHKDAYGASAAYNKAAMGVALSATEQKLLDENFGTNTIIVNDQQMAADIYSDDPDVVQATIDLFDVYTHRFNGQLHPQAKELLVNARNNPELARLSVRVIGQITDGMSKYHGVSTGDALDEIFDLAKISDDQRAFFRAASKTGVDFALEAFSDRGDFNRDLSALLGQRLEGQSLDQAADVFFDKAFEDALQDSGGQALMMALAGVFDSNARLTQRQLTIKEFADSVGLSTSDIARSAIRDPYVKEAVKSVFFKRHIDDYKMGETTRPAMLSAIRSLGKRGFGFERNTETGEIFLVEAPILTYAQAQVPHEKTADGSLQPTVNLTIEAIENQFVEEMLGHNTMFDGALLEPEITEALLRVRNSRLDNAFFPSGIRFVANEIAVEGEVPSYTVILTKADGDAFILRDNYNFNFNKSSLGEDYKAAQNLIKSSKLKKFITSFDLVDRQVLQGTFDKMHRSRSRRSLTSLIDFYNGLSYTMQNVGAAEPIDIDLLTQSEVNQVFDYLDTVFSLGFY